jgi:hypothetical protein
MVRKCSTETSSGELKLKVNLNSGFHYSNREGGRKKEGKKERKKRLARRLMALDFDEK